MYIYLYPAPIALMKKNIYSYQWNWEETKPGTEFINVEITCNLFVFLQWFSTLSSQILHENANLLGLESGEDTHANFMLRSRYQVSMSAFPKSVSFDYFSHISARLSLFLIYPPKIFFRHFLPLLSKLAVQQQLVITKKNWKKKEPHFWEVLLKHQKSPKMVSCMPR